MRRLAAITAVLLALTGLLLPSAAHAAVHAAGTKPATPIASSVTAFQGRVSGVLDKYLASYGDRLSAGERSQAESIATTVDSQLAQIARTTANAERVAASKASRGARIAAADAAVRTFDTGYAASKAAMAQMTPILQPKLNIFEALGAKADFDREMAAYAGLGTRIKALAAAQRR